MAGDERTPPHRPARAAHALDPGLSRAMIRAGAVLFDLDDTLFDRTAAIRHAAHDQAQALGRLLEKTTPEDFVQRLLELDALGYIKRMSIYRQLVHEFGLDAAHRRLHPRRLANDFLRRYGEQSVAIDGAVQTLTALRARGLRLAVVTNGREAVQQRKLAALGVLHLMDAVLISEQEGVRKPDAQIFHRALERLGACAGDAVHVGDHPEDDVRGSRAAGLRACWLRQARWPQPDADATVDRLPELLDMLV